MSETMYKRPSAFTRLVLNAPIKLAVKLGLSPRGAQTLTVRGRKSGEPRTVPVNPMEVAGETYLVGPPRLDQLGPQPPGADASDERLREIAPLHPIFKLSFVE